MQLLNHFDLTVEDEQLLAEHGILGDELSFALGEVSGRGEYNRIVGRLRRDG